MLKRNNGEKLVGVEPIITYQSQFVMKKKGPTLCDPLFFFNPTLHQLQNQ